MRSAAMPERMSAALRMYRVEDVPQKEIAARLGMTLSGVEKLLRRAVKEIQTYKVTAEADLGEPHRLSAEGESYRDR
jgi:DNA-directed RNA polymerase specialized sigma24 family protein